MPSTLDRQRLSEIAAQVSVLQQAQALGMFRPDRIPNVPIPAVPIKAAHFRSAVSPDCSYRLLSDVLQSARAKLRVYVYEIKADYLIKLIADAAARGVDIQLMYDRGGTPAEQREALEQLNIPLKAAPSSGGRSVFTVCHQKFVVADDASVVVESANWAETSIPEIHQGDPFQKGNREWMLRIDDRNVARFFGDLFKADWDVPDLGVPGGLLAQPVEPPGGLLVPAELFAPPAKTFDIGTFDEDLGVMPVISPINYFDAIADLLESATRSIDLQQQYILAGDKVDDLLEVVRRKRQDGCQVRIIVSSAFAKNWNLSVETLDAAGLKDCLKALNLKFFTHCHNKGVIVDRASVVISSTNWSSNSITKAREAGVLIRSDRLAGYFADVFDEDWKEGLKADDVRQRLLDIGPERLI